MKTLDWKSALFAHSKVIIPGIFGNMLEIYDFVLYGYFASTIAELFFPASSKFLSLLLTFSVFAIGFLMRPFGAIVFGHFGDRIGRKKTLAISIIMMAISTTLVGLLPTYNQVGVLAGILLIFCRLIQGFAMGGEFSGAIIYITEHAPVNQRGLYGSWAMFSTFIGILMASAVSAFMGKFLSTESLGIWGWRIPFLMGFFLGLIGLYLRLFMPETPDFLALKKNQKIVKNPLQQAFKNAFGSMGIVMGLNFLPASGFYVLFMYLPTYMTTFLKVPQHMALTINTFSILTIILVIPFIGALSDKIGRKPVLMIGAIGFIVCSYPLFLLLQQGTFISLLFAQSFFSILIGFLWLL